MVVDIVVETLTGVFGTSTLVAVVSVVPVVFANVFNFPALKPAAINLVTLDFPLVPFLAALVARADGLALLVLGRVLLLARALGRAGAPALLLAARRGLAALLGRRVGPEHAHVQRLEVVVRQRVAQP